MVPLIAAVEVEYESTADDVVELNLNLASPKSPTWATISLSRRMLLGFRSQCTMVPWWLWCRYAKASDTSTIMLNL